MTLLLNHFDNAKEIWQAGIEQLKAAGLDQKSAQELAFLKNEINPDQELENLHKENIQVITIQDPNYPKLLKETHHAPFILYYKGNLQQLNKQAIAIVGSRRATQYGRQVVEKLTEELLLQDLLIVSGLALGIDSLAHITCVNNRKPTAAVLGSGLDNQNLYPATNRALANGILANDGIIISEFPIGTMPLKHHFPLRNRIISGLSLGTIVIEAGESSGALITAKYALEQNREVFAVPGNITNPMSIGTNNIIKQGAKLIQSVEDIFDELNLQEIKQFQTNQEIIPDSPEEATILKHLSNEPRHINELVKLTDFSITEVNSTIMMLEMKGQVKNLGNMTYIKSI